MRNAKLPAIAARRPARTWRSAASSALPLLPAATGVRERVARGWLTPAEARAFAARVFWAGVFGVSKWPFGLAARNFLDGNSLEFLSLVQCLLEIVPEGVAVLEPDREPEQAGRYAVALPAVTR